MPYSEVNVTIIPRPEGNIHTDVGRSDRYPATMTLCNGSPGKPGSYVRWDGLSGGGLCTGCPRCDR